VNIRMRVLQASCCLLATLCVSSCMTTRQVTSLADLQQTLDSLSPRVVLIDGFPVLAQPTPYTCGITTAAAVSSFFNQTNRSAVDLIAEYDVATNHGATVEQLRGWLSAELPSHTTTFFRNESNVRMIRRVHESLRKGKPVVVVFGSPSPYAGGLYDFHFSSVCGMDLIRATVTISTAYGYSEEVTLVDFLNRMSFSEVQKYPPALQDVIRRGMDKNQILIVN